MSFAKGSLRCAYYFVVLFVLIFHETAVFSRTLLVPGDALTIQDAVNLSTTGDTVLVKPGVYREFVLLNSRIITLKADGPANTVIIDAPSDKAAITCIQGESASTIITGFTLRNAAIGANVVNASPTIANNIITNCAIGIYSESAGSYLTNEIVACPLGISTKGNAVIRGNRIHAAVSAIRASSGDPLIRENFIFGTTAYGVVIDGPSSPTLIQNVIYDHATAGVAWATAVGVRGPLLIHNTIVGAQGRPAVQASAAIGRSVLVNNILFGRPAIQVDPPSEQPHFAFNLLYAPSGPAVIGASIVPENRNIFVDPNFLAAESADFQLQSTSPAIDGATSTNTTEVDISGESRPVDGNGDSIIRPDIGAYEFIPGLVRPPSSLLATTLFDRVELTWAGVDGATNFVISRATSQTGPFAKIGEIAATNFVDTNLVGGVTYFYIVQGERSGVLSRASSIVSARPGNHAPVAAADSAQMDEDSTITVDVLANDSDADGDPLQVVQLVDPIPQGMQINGSGQITFTSATNATGNFSVQYVITDARGAFATSTISVSVRPINDPPALMIAGQGVVVVANTTTLISPQLADPDSPDISLRIKQQPSAGYLYIVTNTFVYRPMRGFAGADAFSAVAFDGAAESPEAVVNIVVVAPPDNDNDAMADEWENFWDVNNANADADADGLTNLQEFQANTSPKDAASVLKVSRVEKTADGFFKVTWPAVGGVRYRVLSAEQLSGQTSDFVPLTQSLGLEMELAPDSMKVERSFIDVRPLTTNQRFYRVQVLSTTQPIPIILPPFENIIVSGPVEEHFESPGQLMPTPDGVITTEPQRLPE